MNASPLILAAAFCAAAHTSPAGAADAKPLRFEHRDWELVCDNTRTCRAAGYHPEAQEDAPVSVLLERRAGPGQAIVAKVRLGDDENAAAPAALAMAIDGRSLGSIALSGGESIGALSPAQTEALVRAVADSGRVEWRAGRRHWALSGAGAAAVLLKMDEFQGRLGTMGAAIRKGPKADAAALPALAAPNVVAAAVPQGALPPPGKDEQRLLLASLRKTVTGDECELLADAASGKNPLAYVPLSADRMLVSTVCWRAAYNEGSGYWVASRKPPFAVAYVTQMGTGYDKGSISASQRGRGVGDCGSIGEWVWDGRRFVQTLEATTGMCRGIAAGGAWTLPTLVSKVKR